MINQRTQILEDATALVNGPRQDAYGPPDENFERIAAGWRVILKTDVTPSQVALCMAWVKMARLVNAPCHDDSFVDMAAYAALAGELAK